jgi:hypothetical protein
MLRRLLRKLTKLISLTKSKSDQTDVECAVEPLDPAIVSQIRNFGMD